LGRGSNATPESWDRREEGLPPGAEGGGVANFGQPELWVRNVSHASFTPFLPAPDRATGAAMVVLPGGAFMGLAIDREGYSVARWLNDRGISAFVLKYRLSALPADPHEAHAEFLSRVQAIAARVKAAKPGEDTLSEMSSAALIEAREDAIEALTYVRAHAAQWRLAPGRMGVLGFSAGAVIALEAALHAPSQSAPDLIALIYGLIPANVSIPPSAAPAFIAVAADDLLASRSQSIYNAWRKSGASAELHVFENGGHGFGVLKQGKRSDQWMEVYDRWLVAHNFAREVEKR
jgi:acetyl esterase/lipase